MVVASTGHPQSVLSGWPYCARAGDGVFCSYCALYCAYRPVPHTGSIGSKPKYIQLVTGTNTEQVGQKP